MRRNQFFRNRMEFDTSGKTFRGKKHLRQVSAFLLSLLLLFSFTAGPSYAASEKEDSSYHIADADTEILPAYEHYETADFLAGCEELERLAEEGKEDGALSLYDALLEEMKYVDDLTVRASVTYNEDVSDKTNEEEYLYMESTDTECALRFIEAAYHLTETSVAKAFRKHIGDEDYNEILKEGKPLPEEQEISDRISELESQYYTLMDTCEQIPVEYDGISFTYEDFQAEWYAETYSYEERSEMYRIWMQNIGTEAGPIYLELVRLRNEYAQLKGYADFSEYADERIYYRDFSEKDLTAFYQGVKAFATEHNGEFYSDSRDLELSPDELLADVRTLVSGVSDKALSALDQLEEHRLLSIGSEESRTNQAYSVTLSSGSSTSVLFQKLYRYTGDISTTVHELGHVTDAACDEERSYFSGKQYDLLEINSTGLEMLTADRYDLILPEKQAAEIYANQLSYGLDCVIEGCLYDEWQRLVYQNPGMSFREICEAFRELSLEYGYEETAWMGYDWIWVTHNFSSPMYYISYATSFIVSLQIRELADSDFEAAVAAWEYLLGKGDACSYLTRVREAGLTPFTDTEAVTETINYAFDKYTELYAEANDLDLSECLQLIIDFIDALPGRSFRLHRLLLGAIRGSAA